jgi:stage II sporulation protein D
MRKKQLLFLITTLISLATIIGLFIIFYPSPPEKTVKGFLNHLIVHKSTDFDLFLAKHVDNNHPFIILSLEQKPFKSFKILKVQKTTQDDICKIWVSLGLEKGSINVPITVEKTYDRWCIQSLPAVLDLPAAIPILENNHDTKLLLDIAGDRLWCTNPLPSQSLQYSVPYATVLVENQIVDIQPLKPVRLPKIIAISPSEPYIEDSHLGKLSVVKDLPVYSKQEDFLSFQGAMAVSVGSTDSLLYHIGDGVGRVLVTMDSLVPKHGIRVLIRDRNNETLEYKQIKITCDTNFIAEILVKPFSYSFKAGDVLTIKSSDAGTILYSNDQEVATSPYRWHIHPVGEGFLSILSGSSNKHVISVPYRGKLEITPHNNGLIIVNELDLEEYLYSVIPSEMLIKFGLEALKVQAIASRSYAIRCFTSQGYANLGAHVDDSTASQVYNAIKEQSIAVQAVKDTHGMVGFFEGQVIDARFFSTSCGYTANFHEVWSDKEYTFPTKEIPYLVAIPQSHSSSPGLHNEENFRAFIDQVSLDSYDRFSPFFRWSVTMGRNELEASLEHNLPRIQQTNPFFVLTRKGDNTFVQEEIPEEIGELQNLQVTQRGEGGNMMELEITTTHGIFKIIKELNIRQTLQPIDYIDKQHPIQLNCYDGSTRDNFPILPSAFAYIDLHRNTDGDIEQITIKGGGYGHGVGMSQYGAYGMSLLGYSFEQIIEHYYPGSELRNIYIND